MAGEMTILGRWPWASLSLLWALERFGEAGMGRGGCHTFWIQLAQQEGRWEDDLKAVSGCSRTRFGSRL